MTVYARKPILVGMRGQHLVSLSEGPHGVGEDIDYPYVGIIYMYNAETVVCPIICTPVHDLTLIYFCFSVVVYLFPAHRPKSR